MVRNIYSTAPLSNFIFKNYFDNNLGLKFLLNIKIINLL